MGIVGQMRRASVWVGGLASVLWLGVATAQTQGGVPASGDPELRSIEEILVVGARMPRRADNVVGKVDVITGEQLTRELAGSLSDLTRYTPGVSITTSDSRFGETEITIRGLSGNRVVALIDGVPLPDQFDIGSFANAGQDFLVPDAISRIEILRGPASTLFGNDALGGVVAVVTRDPDAYLRGNRLGTGGSVRYSGRDDSTALNGYVALGSETGDMTGVLHVNHSEGHEVDRGAVSGPTDAQDRRRASLFAKTLWSPALGHTLHGSFSLFDEQVDTEMVSVLGWGRQFRNTTALSGDDERTRYAANLGYEFEQIADWLSGGRVNVYWQDVSVDQRTEDLRTPIDTLIRRRFSYDAESYGLTVDLESRFDLAGTPHRLAWGASAERGTLRESRNGSSENLLTGEVSNRLLGEVLPVRDFPNSRVDEFAFYVHDEITLSRFTLIPGLRWQHYTLDARADRLFREDNPAVQVVDARESSLAPKLGLLWDVGSLTTLYAQYARGFRAPPFEDLNIGLDIPLFNLRAIPNPDLKPETSDGFEVGLRHQAGQYRFEVAVFTVDYDDLIATKVNLGRDPQTGTLLFQSQNIDRARVYGTELTFSASLDRWVRGLSLGAAASVARGRDLGADEPLNTVDPAELVTRLDWAPNDRLRLSTMLTAVAKKDDVDDSVSAPFTPDDYLVLDITASYRIRAGLTVDAGLFNAFDATYWPWSSVRGRSTDDPMLDHLSAPGRYASVAIRAEL